MPIKKSFTYADKVTRVLYEKRDLFELLMKYAEKSVL